MAGNGGLDQLGWRQFGSCTYEVIINLWGKNLRIETCISMWNQRRKTSKSKSKGTAMETIAGKHIPGTNGWDLRTKMKSRMGERGRGGLTWLLERGPRYKKAEISPRVSETCQGRKQNLKIPAIALTWKVDSQSKRAPEKYALITNKCFWKHVNNCECHTV